MNKFNFSKFYYCENIYSVKIKVDITIILTSGVARNFVWGAYRPRSPLAYTSLNY